MSCCGLGVRRPGTQAHDDMPPAACCAWSARSSRTEPDRGGRVLLCRTAPGRPGVRVLFVVRDRSHIKASGSSAPVQARRVAIMSGNATNSADQGRRSATEARTSRRSATPAAAAPAAAAAAVARGRPEPGPQRDRVDEGEHRPAALRGHPAQRPVRVDHGRMPDGLQQRQVGDRVGVGPAVGQPVAARRRRARGRPAPSPRRSSSTRSPRCSGRRSTPIRVAWQLSAPTSAAIGSTTSSPDADSTTTSSPSRPVLGDQLGRLGVDQRLHDLVQRLGHDGPDLRDLPPGAQRGDPPAQQVHGVGVRAGQHEQQLGVAAAQRRPPADQSLAAERAAEGQRAGARR